MKRYSLEEKKLWAELYLECYDLTKVSKHFKIPKSTLHYYLKYQTNIERDEYSPQEKELWINLYCSGFGIVSIEKIINKKSRKNIRNLLKEVGVYEKPLNIGRDYGEKIIELYDELFSSEQIANKLNISKSGVHKYLTSIEKNRSNYETYVLKIRDIERYFDKLDNQIKVYWFGFIIADGHFHQQGLRISLNQIDKDYIKQLAEIFDVKTRDFERKRPNGYISKMVQLDFNSKYMSKSVNELYGCGGNKARSSSLHEIFDKIPKKYINHFVRGYFDGDGSAGVYLTKRGDLRRNFGFTGNIKFINELIKILSKYTGSSKRKSFPIKNSNYSSAITYSSKDDIQKIVEWIYSDHKICLIRKRDKVEKILSSY